MNSPLTHYRFIRLIGKGSFGRVALAVHKLSGVEVAVKIFEKAQMARDEYRRKRVQQEIYIHKKMHHSHIVKVIQAFENREYLFLVMDYACGGDLLNLVRSKGKLHENEARNLFKQILLALAYTHCRSVTHRDLKLDNFLLTKDGKIKLCDFGVSRIARKGDFVTDKCGTPAYLAPEIIKN